MLIHTFPPRRICLVIAIRAASICRFVTYACSSAWMPYSPNDTLVPPVALPCRSGRCCLRCLTLRGMSIPQPSSPAVAATSAGVPVPALTGAQRGLVGLALGPGGRRFALVDPDLDPDPAERRACLVEAVVDVGAQGVQRHAALAVELRPRHL